MGMLTNIRIVSKYETKLLVRGWFFKVFAFLAILTGLILGANYILTQYPYPQLVNRSVIPYIFMLVMNVGQAVVSVFLASEYLKRDKQLDTSEVFYTRPLSNAEYLLGKMWATLKVFFILDFAVAAIALVMSLIKYGFALGLTTIATISSRFLASSTSPMAQSPTGTVSPGSRSAS